jgi:hypothetical protein
MKIKTTLLFLGLIPFWSSSQSILDSLTEDRNGLIKHKLNIEQQIVEVEKEIISQILSNGYEITIKSTFNGQTFDLKSPDASGNTIATLKDGDKVTVIGKESIYFKVKFGELDGRLFIPVPDYPISLLSDYKYKDHVESRSHSSDSTRSNTKVSNCSSTQCKGYTQKGARCRNMTTSCSGRCHLH